MTDLYRSILITKRRTGTNPIPNFEGPDFISSSLIVVVLICAVECRKEGWGRSQSTGFQSLPRYLVYVLRQVINLQLVATFCLFFLFILLFLLSFFLVFFFHLPFCFSFPDDMWRSVTWTDLYLLWWYRSSLGHRHYSREYLHLNVLRRQQKWE